MSPHAPSQMTILGCIQQSLRADRFMTIYYWVSGVKTGSYFPEYFCCLLMQWKRTHKSCPSKLKFCVSLIRVTIKTIIFCSLLSVVIYLYLHILCPSWWPLCWYTHLHQLFKRTVPCLKYAGIRKKHALLTSSWLSNNFCLEGTHEFFMWRVWPWKRTKGRSLEAAGGNGHGI